MEILEDAVVIDSDIVKVAEKTFMEFLQKKKLRRTAERFVILREIYSRKDHFDAEALYISLRNKRFLVSRATIYNTLELLHECGLVFRHHFGKKMMMFEKSFGYKQHNHIICLDCGKIIEFTDPRIEMVADMVNNKGYEVKNQSLTFYVRCKQHQQGFCECEAEPEPQISER